VHENRGYAKLEDGREIPIAMVQPFKPTEVLPESKTRVTSKAVKPKYEVSPEQSDLAKKVTAASKELTANPSVENSQAFNDALQALHKAELAETETAASRALKKHMEAQAKAPSYTATPDIPKKRKNGKTSAEDAAKQSAAAKAQNKEKNPSSMVKKKDEE